MRLVLKKPVRDGTTAIEMQPLALLSRLSTAVPPPRRHTISYAGVLGSASKLRPLVIPPPPQAAPGDAACVTPPPPEPPRRPPTHRCRYRPLIELLARTFGEDRANCEACGGPMKLVALVKDPDSVRRFLVGVGLAADPPPLAPARGPPYFPTPGRGGARDAGSAPTRPAPEPLDDSA